MHFNTKNLTGQTSKFWRIIEIDKTRRYNGQICWMCECLKCHKIQSVSYWGINTAVTSSCECKNEMIGQKFNSLTIIGKPEFQPELCNGKERNRTFVLCRCNCGEEKKYRLSDVRRGSVKSCGCWCYEKDENGHSLIKEKRITSSQGYILIYAPGHPKANNRDRIPEHRFVMEKYLGRYLNDNETVHHKNGIKSDNRIENLELWANNHQKGQRVEDLVAYAKEILEKHDNYKNPTKEYFIVNILSPVQTCTTLLVNNNFSNTSTASSTI